MRLELERVRLEARRLGSDIIEVDSIRRYRNVDHQFHNISIHRSGVVLVARRHYICVASVIHELAHICVHGNVTDGDDDTIGWEWAVARRCRVLGVWRDGLKREGVYVIDADRAIRPETKAFQQHMRSEYRRSERLGRILNGVPVRKAGPYRSLQEMRNFWIQKGNLSIRLSA